MNGHSESKPSAGGNQPISNETIANANLGRMSVSQSSDPLVKETKSLGRLSVSQNLDAVKEPKPLTSNSQTFFLFLFLFIYFLIFKWLFLLQNQRLKKGG